MADTALQHASIGQISVTVRDLRRAVAFYRDVLQLPFLFQAPPDLAFFDCGGTRLMLAAPESGESYSSILYYRVDDIDETTDTLKARGVVFENDPHLVARTPEAEVWMAFFRDSEQNLLALMTEIPTGSGA